MNSVHNPTKVCSRCGIVHGRSLLYEIGEDVSVVCVFCGTEDIRLGQVLVESSSPSSIAGTMPKMAVQTRNAMVCGGCGHVSVAKTDEERARGVVFQVVGFPEVQKEN